MGKRNTHGDTMDLDNGVGSRIVKFTPIITQNTLDGAAKLGFFI
jgi:hypothetical protein